MYRRWSSSQGLSFQLSGRSSLVIQSLECNQFRFQMTKPQLIVTIDLYMAVDRYPVDSHIIINLHYFSTYIFTVNMQNICARHRQLIIFHAYRFLLVMSA